MDTGKGEEGEGRVNRERNMETHTLPWVKIDNQWEFAVSLRELRPGLCNNLEGWERVGRGRKIPEGGDICIPMADS